MNIEAMIGNLCLERDGIGNYHQALFSRGNVSGKSLIAALLKRFRKSRSEKIGVVS